MVIYLEFLLIFFAEEMLAGVSRLRYVFFMQFGMRKKKLCIHLKIYQREDEYFSFELIIRDNEKMTTSRLIVNDSKRCVLISNLL